MEKAKGRKITLARSLACGGSQTRWMVLIVAVLVGGGVLGVVVQAYNRAASEAVAMKPPSAFASLELGNLNTNLQSRLMLQPEADRFRRRLGQRFLAPGREKTALIGSLTIGSDSRPISIVRTQGDGGEDMQIAVSGGSSSLSWSAGEGAKSGSSRATTDERQFIERVTLDSPDQFILAQLRGASYYTIARNVMPAEAHGSEDYSGPVWDVVRVSEYHDGGDSLLLNPTRHYFFNSSTGLLETVVSEENGEAIVAELSGWLTQGGELVPATIVWKRNGQAFMQLTVINISIGPRQ